MQLLLFFAKFSLCLMKGGEYMSKLITKEQEREIEQLAIEHSDALIAFGVDLYRQGMFKGGVIVLAGIVVGKGISLAYEKLVTNKQTTKEEV